MLKIAMIIKQDFNMLFKCSASHQFSIADRFLNFSVHPDGSERKYSHHSLLDSYLLKINHLKKKKEVVLGC